MGRGGDTTAARQDRSTVQNKKVFKDMAERMAEAGYIRTLSNCRTIKLKVKKYYKDARSTTSQAGLENDSARFYDILHQILGHRPTLEPEVRFRIYKNKVV